MSDEQQNVAENQEATNQTQQEESQVEEKEQGESQAEGNSQTGEQSDGEQSENVTPKSGETSGEGTGEGDQEKSEDTTDDSGEATFSPEPDEAPATTGEQEGSVDDGATDAPTEDGEGTGRPETLDDEVVDKNTEDGDLHTGKHDMGENPPAMEQAKNEEPAKDLAESPVEPMTQAPNEDTAK